MSTERYVNPEDVSVPPGYRIEAYYQGLDTPIGLIYTEVGDLIIAESGYSTGNPRILRLAEGRAEVLAEGFSVPIYGINSKGRDLYVSHKGSISIIKPDGTIHDIIKGLPSYGDYGNNRVSFGPDNKIYLGQGTATNSGVVGLDNSWIYERPHLHDYPGSYILVNGINYETANAFVPAEKSALTGAFRPFGVPLTSSIEVIDGRLRASGSILRANLDGTDLELVAWGLRNPVQLNYDSFNQLYLTNQSYDIRGSRPIANALDEFQLLTPGAWYGWPDYTGGMPVNQPRFTPEGAEQPALLLASIPSIPPRPLAVFQADSNIMGFEFNSNPSFGQVGEAYVAEFGSIRYGATGELIRSGVGHRITKVDPIHGQVSTFAINKSGFPAITPLEGGLGRPTDVTFGPDGAMYVTDFTATTLQNPDEYLPNTGVIWRISRM
jgi:glucose/arabinose dehydrogenase